MTNPLVLYPDFATPLWPDAPLRLHRIPQEVDLCALRVIWEHHTYGGSGFDAPRLRPSVVRLRTPGGGSLPELMALAGYSFTGYERVQQSYSAEFGQIVKRDRYYRFALLLCDLDLPDQRTPWLRLRPGETGFILGHGLEHRHITWYQRDADPWYVNHGLAVISCNLATLGPTFANTIWPRLDLPEYAFLLQDDPPLPEASAMPSLCTDPVPLPSGDWTLEISHGAASYQGGKRGKPPFERRFNGIAFMEASAWADAAQPLSAITGPLPVRRLQRTLVDEFAWSGHVPAQEYQFVIPVPFGG